MNQNQFNKAINELPVHVSFPLSRIINTQNYFKKLNLISDVLLALITASYVLQLLFAFPALTVLPSSTVLV